MLQNALFGGVNAAVLTPMNADLSVDLDRMAAHCRWLLAHGFEVEILDLGLASETVTDLTQEENAAHLRSFGFGRPFLSERLDRVLAATNGNKSRAAQILGIERTP